MRIVAFFAVLALAAAQTDELESAYQNLKAAEAKKDPAEIKKWALETSQIARKVGPEDSKRADYARQVDIYCEYSLYATALQSADPAKTIDLVEALQQLNSQSQYLPKVYANYLTAMRQSGQPDRAGEEAIKLSDTNAAGAEVLLIAADYTMQKKSQPDKVIQYSSKMLDLLTTGPKPEGFSDADWETRKNGLSGLANWMLGVTYSAQLKYAQADKALRAALPNLKDDQVRASGLFYVGLANYQLGKAAKNRSQIREALQFSEQSAAIKSPLQEQALKNVRAIRGELGLK